MAFSRQIRLREVDSRAAQDLVLLLQQTHTSLELARLGSILALSRSGHRPRRRLGASTCAASSRGRRSPSRSARWRRRPHENGPHNIVAELLGSGAGIVHILPGPRRQASSDVTDPRGGPQRLQAGALASEGGGRLETGRDERWGVHGPTVEGPTAGANGVFG